MNKKNKNDSKELEKIIDIMNRSGNEEYETTSYDGGKERKSIYKQKSIKDNMEE